MKLLLQDVGELTMPQQCPHCMTEIHENASTCPACSAIRGVWGRSVESWRQTSTFLLGFAAVIFVLGVALWTWIASDYSATWFDGMIGFLLLSPFMLFFASIGLVLRYAIPRMQESWYR